MSVEEWMATGTTAILATWFGMTLVLLLVSMRQGNQDEDDPR